jgi:hypothetical protein
MLDWIHWGGQLIISGPNSLDKLKGSFLAPYLPAESGQALKLDQTSFDELNKNWSQASIGNGKKKPMTAEERSIKFVGNKPMLGVELKKHPLGDFLAGTGNLVVERRVGGGRIAATAFPLTDIRVRLWPGFDGFLNAACSAGRRGVLSERHRRAADEMGFPSWRTMCETAHLQYAACFSRDVGFPKDTERPAGVADHNYPAGKFPATGPVPLRTTSRQSPAGNHRRQATQGG